jgi:hypothetical protein
VHESGLNALTLRPLTLVCPLPQSLGHAADVTKNCRRKFLVQRSCEPVHGALVASPYYSFAFWIAALRRRFDHGYCRSHRLRPHLAVRSYDRRIMLAYLVLALLAIAALHFAFNGPGFAEADFATAMVLP